MALSLAAGRRVGGAKGRKMAKGAKPPRMNRGVSEAAEALLGMGIGEMMDDDDSLVSPCSCIERAQSHTRACIHRFKLPVEVPHCTELYLGSSCSPVDGENSDPSLEPAFANEAMP